MFRIITSSPSQKKCPHFCEVLKCSRASFAFARFSNGSQILSELGYPFHLIRYSRRLYLFLSPTILSTSYSSVLSMISGGGGCGRKNLSELMYGLRSETWKVG